MKLDSATAAIVAKDQTETITQALPQHAEEEDEEDEEEDEDDEEDEEEDEEDEEEDEEAGGTLVTSSRFDRTCDHKNSVR